MGKKREGYTKERRTGGRKIRKGKGEREGRYGEIEKMK